MHVNFTPEQEAQIAKVAANVGTDPEAFVKDAALRLVDEGARFSVSAQDDRPIWEVIVERAQALPAEAFEGLPKDGASQIDHYLYGHPKRD